MLSLQSFKEQYPQYKDVPDDKLIPALHKKYYSNIDFNEFAGKVAEASKPIEEPSSTLRRAIVDPAISLAGKGAIGAGETIIGALDLVSGGHAGKFLEDHAKLYDWQKKGYDPQLTTEVIDSLRTPEARQAAQKVAEANGFIDKATAAITNPSTIVDASLSSVPAMGLGWGITGGIAPIISKLAPVLGPAIAGGIGEGLVTAAQNSEQVRQESPDRLLSTKQIALNLGAGGVTGVIGAVSGRVAQKLGLTNVDTLFAGADISDALKGKAVRRIVGGALEEGLLEELPQSIQEQMAQNLSNDKPIMDGVDEAAVMGALSGAAMGGVVNIKEGHHSTLQTDQAPASDIPVLSPQAQMAADASDTELADAFVNLSGHENPELVKVLAAEIARRKTKNSGTFQTPTNATPEKLQAKIIPINENITDQEALAESGWNKQFDAEAASRGAKRVIPINEDPEWNKAFDAEVNQLATEKQTGYEQQTARKMMEAAAQRAEAARISKIHGTPEYQARLKRQTEIDAMDQPVQPRMIPINKAVPLPPESAVAEKFDDDFKARAAQIKTEYEKKKEGIASKNFFISGNSDAIALYGYGNDDVSRMEQREIANRINSKLPKGVDAPIINGAITPFDDFKRARKTAERLNKTDNGKREPIKLETGKYGLVDRSTPEGGNVAKILQNVAYQRMTPEQRAAKDQEAQANTLRRQQAQAEADKMKADLQVHVDALNGLGVPTMRQYGEPDKAYLKRMASDFDRVVVNRKESVPAIEPPIVVNGKKFQQEPEAEPAPEPDYNQPFDEFKKTVRAREQFFKDPNLQTDEEIKADYDGFHNVFQVDNKPKEVISDGQKSQEAETLLGQDGNNTPDASGVPEMGTDSAPARGTSEPVKPIRFEEGKKLTKEDRAKVLSSIVDVYKEKGAPIVDKGLDSRGDNKSGYDYSPDLFEVSDITGKKIRRYITLPDGRKAHPSELYPEMTDAYIDRKLFEAEKERKALKASKEEDTRLRNARIVSVDGPFESVLENAGNPQKITHDSAEGLANWIYTKKSGRKTDGSYFAKNSQGQLVRVDGKDAEDVAFYEAAGFKKIDEPAQPAAPQPEPGKAKEAEDWSLQKEYDNWAAGEESGKTKEPWNYLDVTHPDAIQYNKGGFASDFAGGENLSVTQKKEYHQTWIDRLNKELKTERGTETNTYGVPWANKSQRKTKSENVKKLLDRRQSHEKALKELKKESKPDLQAQSPGQAQGPTPREKMAKAAEKAKGKPEARKMDTEGRPLDRKPILPGDVFISATGRKMTPYPKYSTKRSTKIDEIKSNQWLKENAVAEAEARQDKFNLNHFQHMDPRNMSTAGMQGALMYLHDEGFAKQPIPKPILKPLTAKPETDPARVQEIKNSIAEGEGKILSESPFKPGEVETGKPVKFYYIHNTEKSYNAGTEFAQDIEPAGQYVAAYRGDMTPSDSRFEHGVVELKNPLVLENKTPRHGGWKTDLSKMFGGRRGKALSRAIVKAGYDGIITTDKNRISESVALDPKAVQRSVDNPEAKIGETGREYTSPNNIETPAQGNLNAALKGKKAAFDQVKRLRERIKNEPLGGNRQGLRLELLKAEDNHKQWLETERQAKDDIEKRANELGKTTIQTKETDKGVELYQRRQDQPPLSGVTLKQVQALPFFKGKAVTVKDGIVTVQLNPNQTLRIEGIVGAGGTVQAHLGILDKATGAAGAGKFLGKTITLSQIADIGTAYHEVSHAVEEMGFLKPMEIAAINEMIRRETGKAVPGGVAGKEARAEWVDKALTNREKYRAGVVGRILQKIADMVDGVVNLFKQTGRGVLTSLESGKVFDRTENKRKSTVLAPAYQESAARTPEMRTNALREGMPLFQKKPVKSFSDRFFAEDVRPNVEREKSQAEYKKASNIEEATASTQKFIKKSGKSASKIIDGIKKLGLPSSLSPEHLTAAEVLGAEHGAKERMARVSHAALKSASQMFDKLGVFNKNVPLEDHSGMKFASDMSTGREVEPKFKAIKDAINNQFDIMKTELEKAGAAVHELQNYFPGAWTRDSIRAFNKAVSELNLPEEKSIFDLSKEERAGVKARVQELLKSGDGLDTDIGLEYFSKRPLKGNESFRKQKVFDKDYMDAIEFGLVPKSLNPIDIVDMKLAEMRQSLLINRALRSWESTGDKKFLPIDFRVPAGWKKINDKYGTVYGPMTTEKKIGLPILGYHIVKAPVADILENYLSRPLYNNQYFGEAFKGYMWVGNLLNQIQLGVGSAFHAGFMVGETGFTSLGNNMGDVYGLVKGTRTMDDVLTGFLHTLSSPVTNYKMGKNILREYSAPGTGDAHDQLIAKAVELAGGRAYMESELRTHQWDAMLRDYYAGNKIKAAARSPIAFIEMTAAPIMQWLVPSLKMGAFSEKVDRLMKDHPGKAIEELSPQLRKAWNFIDGAMGQVDYTRLFINNTAKNVIQAIVRAPGWSGGTIINIGGAFKDSANFVKEWINTGKAPDKLPDRVAYTVALLTGAAVINGALTMLLTGGEPPEGMDYWAFRTGDKDEYGRPERFMLPAYTKDIMSYWNHPGKTLLDKTHPLLNVIGSLFITNKDYYGVKIANEDDKFLTRVEDRIGYGIKQFIPFWMRGVYKMSGQDKNIAEMALPLIGIMPAPALFNKTDAEVMMADYMMDKMPIGGRTKAQAQKSELVRKITRKFITGHGSDGYDLIREYAKTGDITDRDIQRIGRNVSTPAVIGAFKRLSIDEALNVFEVATEKEKKQLRPFLNRKGILIANKPLKERKELLERFKKALKQ